MNTPDRTLWQVINLNDLSTITFDNEEDALDCFRENQRDRVLEVNAFEHRADDVTDDFAERLEGEEIAARSMRAHERSFAVGRM